MSVQSLVGGVVGGVAGFFLGGPAGAAIGFGVGAGIFGALSAQKGPSVPGPRLSDLTVQTSTYGAFIPRVYGTIGIHGNLLWLENNKLKETVRKKKQGGKGGGGGTTVKTYSYSATFILALCQGPIAGVRRIWCMDKLIYNAGSEDLETIIASNQNASGWKLYPGTEDQMPDPRYEADVGVGNASAFRGIAYLAFYDFQLADYGNTLQAAQFKVEVITERQEEGGVVLLDITPPGTPVFGMVRGVTINSTLEQFRYISNTTTSYADVGKVLYGRAYERDDRIHAIEKLGNWESVISFDGRSWGQYNSTRLANEKIAITENGQYIWNSMGVGDLQWLWSTPSNYRMMASPAVSPSAHSFFAKAYLPGDIDDGIAAVTTEMVGVTPGYAGMTAGSSPFEVRFMDGVLNYRVLDEDFALVSSHSIILGSGYFPNITGASENSSTQYFYNDGKLYIVYKTSDTNLRISIFFEDVLYLEYNVPIAAMIGGLSMLRMLGDYQGAVCGRRIIQWNVPVGSVVTLEDVIRRECLRSSLLSPTDIDASELAQPVRGYRVSGGTIRAAIEPLQGAFPFDVVPSGYQIKCVPRGQSPVSTIPWEDLGAAEGGTPGDILQQSREMDTQLPARTTIKYLDAVREYAASEQYAERINTEAVNRVDRELPLVLTADEAAGVAEVLQFLPWLERTDAALTLPPTYLHLEPSDVVTVATPDATHQLRLTEVNYTQDGRLECKAKPNRAALYTPNATGGEGVPPIGIVPLRGESLFLLLDIPVVDETFQDDVGFVGCMTGTTESWPGGVLFRSNDGAQTWVDIQGFIGKATFGTVQGSLPSSNATLIDQRSLVVELISGELESVTRDQMLSGVNYAAYGADGRWEIVRFQNAVLEPDGRYAVSHFLRGERGTEWATGLHQDGDSFVLLDDPDNIFIGVPVESIGLHRLYRGVTSGTSIDSANDTNFTYRGVNLECLSPVYARGSRDGSGNFTGVFTRRSRLSSSWWANGIEAPLGETTQAYEVDVMSGSTVVRTITVSAPTFSYSAANQTTDFGSPQSSINFRIYQLSGVVGRGYPLEVTL